MDNLIDGLVSIIMPAYNAEDFISDSIESVRSQTYQNWELIITDDCSFDNTLCIVEKYAKIDGRIKVYRLDKNSGAAVARNYSIKKAMGQYIAFLDSDDLWTPEKLQHQITFMKKIKSSFCSTLYERMEENGKKTGIVVDNSNIESYKDLLKNCPGNSTIIFDAKIIGKQYGEKIRKRNDYVLWLKVIKQSKRLDCFKENLTFYRVRKGSISSNKVKLIRYHWHIYRNIEGLGFFESLYLVSYWCTKGIKKKLKM